MRVLLADQVVVHGAGQQQATGSGRARPVASRSDRTMMPGARRRWPRRRPRRRSRRGAPPGRRAPSADRRNSPRIVDGSEAGQVAVVVDVDDLGQLLVVDDGTGQDDLAAAGRPGVEQVALRARWSPPSEVTSSSRIASSGGLVTWAKSCGEVVEQQPGPLRQHGERGVGAHRADRLGAGRGPSARSGCAAPPRCSRTAAGGDHRLVLGRCSVKRSGRSSSSTSAGVQPVARRDARRRARP